MATTQNNYTGNGTNKLFSITFPYLDTTDIYVLVNGTQTTAYTFANATTIEMTTAPANGATVVILRSTDDTNLQATFFPGSSIKASDLNNDFDQVLFIAQETTNEAQAATFTAANATTTANSALSASASAVTTANTANTNASAAVVTANTASTNASNAVTTANTANSTSNTANTTANAAVVTANAASATAATAVSTANGAVTTANTASTNASAAVSTANTASTNASAAVSTANTALSTANTASTNASTAVTTANSAVTTANTANTNASAAVTTANAAAAAVANSVLYTTVANVAAIPASPANNTAVEVTNSTGIQSFTPLSGLPAGFVGSSGLSVRIIYQTAGSTWTWIQYFPNDPENRYLGLAGGTLTGALLLSGAPTVGLNPTTKTYVDAADSTLTTAAAAAQSTANTANTTANTANTTANAALPKAGGTMTGVLAVTAGTAALPGIAVSGDTNTGIYSPGADTLALVTGGTNRVHVTSGGLVGIGTSSPVSKINSVISQADNAAASDTTLANSFLHLGGGEYGLTRYFLTTYGYSTGRTNSGAFIGAIGASASGFGKYDLVFGTRDVTTDTAPDTRMIIKTDGKVGIGTTSPLTKLVASNGGAEGIEFAPGVSSNINQTYHYNRTGSAYATNESLAAAHVFKIAANEAARLDSSGRLLVGTSSARSTANTSTNAQVQIETAGTFAAQSISSNSNDATGSYLSFVKSRGTVAGSTTVVSSGDYLGLISFDGANGSGLNSAAYIHCQIDGTPGANDMPGRLVFSTTADGAASPTERFRITNNGSFWSTIPGGSTIYPHFAARAWVNFNGTGTVTIRASGNVSSITDNGTGDYTVNFTTAMVDANYALTAQAGNGGVSQTAGTSITGAAPTTTTARILVDNGAGQVADREYVNVAIFR